MSGAAVLARGITDFDAARDALAKHQLDVSLGVAPGPRTQFVVSRAGVQLATFAELVDLCALAGAYAAGSNPLGVAPVAPAAVPTPSRPAAIDVTDFNLYTARGRDEAARSIELRLGYGFRLRDEEPGFEGRGRWSVLCHGVLLATPGGLRDVIAWADSFLKLDDLERGEVRAGRRAVKVGG